MSIFRRTNCIITASGLSRMTDESSLLSSGIHESPDAVIIQFVLLKMGILMIETSRGF
jgi:hypothetical protein